MDRASDAPRGVARRRGGNRTTGDIASRFWPLVSIRGRDECWPWRSAEGSGRHANFWLDGGYVHSHRVAYWLTHGKWPVVCRHTCDNPPCVNPAHLLDGTQKDNIRDAKARDRLRGGSSNPGATNGMAKINEADVLLMYEARKRGATIDDLAECFEVGRAQAWNIVTGRQWKHLYEKGDDADGHDRRTEADL